MRDAIMHLSFIYRSLRGETVCCVVHCVGSRAWRGWDRGHYASKYVERRDCVLHGVHCVGSRVRGQVRPPAACIVPTHTQYENKL